MKPLIAHVIDGLGSGGAEAMLVTNLRHFRKGPFEHLVVLVFDENSPAYANAHFWANEVRALGIRVVELKCRRSAALAVAAAKLAWVLRTNEVAIVHTHLLWAGLVGRLAAKMAGVPVVSSIHTLSYEPEVLGTYRSPRSIKHQLARLLETASLRLASEVVAVGQAVLESAVAGLAVPRERIRVIYNPVDFEALDAQNQRSRAQLFGPLGLAESSRIVLNVARVSPGKNQIALVEALAQLGPHFNDVHLVVLGSVDETGYVERVRQAAQGLGLERRVHLVGRSKEIGAWLRQAQVFAFPTIYEGLPIALIEAAGSGCCCVVSDIAPNREVVEHQHSALVADAGGFSKALATVLSDAALRTRLSKHAHEQVRERFSPETSISALRSLYERLLS